MEKGADSCIFCLFWIWQPGLTHCVRQQSIKDPERWKPPDRSVADSMSDRLDESIKAAKIDCEAPLVIVRKIIREDNYAILNCRLEDFDDCLDKFEEFLTKRRDTVPHTGESSEDGSIHDILGLHFYQCSFCPTVVDTGADLKAHIESDHLDDIFKFDCCHCSFNAEGPRDLDKHKKIVHGSYGDITNELLQNSN